MNWLDIVIVVILVISLAGGVRNGAIKSILSLAGVIIGVVLAGRYYTPLAGILTFIPSAGAARITAFIIILIAAIIVFTIIAELLTKLVSAILLGWLNRLLGAMLGVVLGGIFISAILAIWIKFTNNTGFIADSAIASILLKYFPVILSLLPAEFEPVRSFFR